MFAPLSQFQWRTNGAQWLAPLLNGASKKQWQKVPAISFFQQRANGAMAATRVYQKRESE